MRNVVLRSLRLCSIFLSLSVHAADFKASLDQSNIVVDMSPPTPLRVTLKNDGAAPVYLTGVGLSFSDGIDGAIYDPTLFQEKLRKLNPGESWDGPFVLVRPNHRGPLLIKGFIHVKGGKLPTSVDDIASIPLSLTINDPRRQLDGSYDPAARPTCDRDGAPCCDPSEPFCFAIANRCIYVAEGYGRQNLCVDRTADKTYGRVFDVHVSSNASHIAYLAGSQCLEGGDEERCKRMVVVDHVEQPALEMPSHLQLSPDGRHYAYLGRKLCVWRDNVETCSGPTHPVMDGNRVDKLPDWYLVDAPQAARSSVAAIR